MRGAKCLGALFLCVAALRGEALPIVQEDDHRRVKTVII